MTSKMDHDLPELPPVATNANDQADHSNHTSDEIASLEKDFQARLVTANLRTEAVRAGMIDLDGLKLIDSSAVRLDRDDKVIDGRRLMEELRRNKPWLFGTASSSSGAVAPASQPVRQKNAMEMTDEEYTTARIAVTKYQF